MKARRHPPCSQRQFTVYFILLLGPSNCLSGFRLHFKRLRAGSQRISFYLDLRQLLKMIATDVIVVSSISALVQLFLVVMYNVIYWIFSNFAYVVLYVTTRSYPPSFLLNQSFKAVIPPTLAEGCFRWWLYVSFHSCTCSMWCFQYRNSLYSSPERTHTTYFEHMQLQKGLGASQLPSAGATRISVPLQCTPG